MHSRTLSWDPDVNEFGEICVEKLSRNSWRETLGDRAKSQITLPNGTACEIPA